MAFRGIKKDKLHISLDPSSSANFGSRLKINSLSSIMNKSNNSRTASSKYLNQQKDRSKLNIPRLNSQDEILHNETEHSSIGLEDLCKIKTATSKYRNQQKDRPNLNIPRLNSQDEILHNETEHSSIGLEDLCKIRNEHNQELMEKCEELSIELIKEKECRRRVELQLMAYSKSDGVCESLKELKSMLEDKDVFIEEISKERDFLKKDVVPVLEHTIKLYERYREQMELELESKNKELELMKNTENSLEDPILETEEEDSLQIFNFDLFFRNKETTDPHNVTRSLCSSPNISIPKGSLTSRPVSSMKQLTQTSHFSPKSSVVSIVPTSKHKIPIKFSTTKLVLKKSPESCKKKFTPSFLRAPKVADSTNSRVQKVLSFPTKKLMSSTK